jgi:hypothetical protein
MIVTKRIPRLIPMLIMLSVFILAYSLLANAYAEKYDLDEITVDLPSHMKVSYQYSPEGYKIYEIIDIENDRIFGLVSFVDAITNPTAFENGLDYRKQITIITKNYSVAAMMASYLSKVTTVQWRIMM